MDELNDIKQQALIHNTILQKHINEYKKQIKDMESELNIIKKDKLTLSLSCNSLQCELERQLVINQALFIICVLMMLIIFFQSSIISFFCIVMTLIVGFCHTFMIFSGYHV